MGTMLWIEEGPHSPTSISLMTSEFVCLIVELESPTANFFEFGNANAVTKLSMVKGNHAQH